MKKMFIIMTMLFVMLFGDLFAQSTAYISAKQVAISYGYTIVEEKGAYIIEGDFVYNYRTFYEGCNYVIYADSDDSDVQDVDIYTYYSDGIIRDKDITSDKNAVISFIPGATIQLKIVVCNAISKDKINGSLCRYFIGYK